MLSDVTDLINQIRENEWEADYVRKIELAALVDDYLCSLKFPEDDITYGTDDYEVVFPNFIEKGHIIIEYKNIYADTEKNGRLYLEDKNFVFNGISLVQKFNGNEEYVIEDADGNEILKGDLDLSNFVLHNTEKYLIAHDTSGEKPVKKYEMILSVSCKLGFAPISKKIPEEAVKEGD